MIFDKISKYNLLQLINKHKKNNSPPKTLDNMFINGINAKKNQYSKYYDTNSTINMNKR